MQKAMIFIDGRNFESAVNRLYEKTTLLDYEKLSAFIGTKADYFIQRTYFYIAQGDSKIDAEKYQKSQKFIEFLNAKDNFMVKVGRLEYLGDRDDKTPIYIEKQTDVNIAVDMTSLAFTNAYDTAIIVSADTDYVPVLNLVRFLGKKVILCSVEGQKTGILKKHVDVSISLNKEELDKVKR